MTVTLQREDLANVRLKSIFDTFLLQCHDHIDEFESILKIIFPVLERYVKKIGKLSCDFIHVIP
jgi:hypothetical protein